MGDAAGILAAMGGGAMPLPSMSSGATTGDQTTNSSFAGGAINFGAGSGAGNSNTLMIVAAALVAVYLITRKK